MLKAHALRSAAKEIAELVAPIEASNDTTISLQAKLISRTIEARMEANLPAAAGHSAIVRMAASLAATVQARTEFLAAHEELAGLRTEYRIPVAYGTPDGCPSSATLRVVEETVAA